VLISYETYAHVKDTIQCEERGQIRVRGIAYPVATYAVVALKSDTRSDGGRIHAELPHLRLEADPELMSAEERDQAAAALRQALSRFGNGRT
jgi:hypothetical protein